MDFKTPQLRRVSLAINDGTHGSFSRVASGVPLLSAKNIYGGNVNVGDNESLIAESDYALISRPGHFRNGDVLVTIVGSIGRTAILNVNFPVAFQRSVASIRPGPMMEARFLRYALESTFLQDQLISGTRTSAQGGIYLGDLAEARIPTPSLIGQRAIAAYLDAETARIDALIAKKRRLVELLEERWVGHLIEVTHSKLTGVVAPALRRAVDHIVGGAWGGEPGTGEVDVTCVRGTDFDTRTLTAKTNTAPRRGLTLTEYWSRRLLSGDLVIEKSGGGENQPVGRVIEWTSDTPAVPTNFAARMRPALGINSRYLTFVFRAAYEMGLTRSWIKQTTGIQNLDIGGLLHESWPIPSNDDQKRRASDLDEARAALLRLVERIGRQIDLLTEHRQALITAAVTGALPVPNLPA
ncbi:MAG: restriction endonuclease subunit S [Anaerolineae bacterium]